MLAAVNIRLRAGKTLTDLRMTGTPYPLDPPVDAGKQRSLPVDGED